MQTAFTTSYTQLSSYNNLEAFDYCIVCLFFVDMVLNFNTAYYQESKEAYVIDRQTIVLNYLFSMWFPIDVVSTIPIDVFVDMSLNQAGSNPSLKAVQLVKIIRLLRLAKLIKLLQSMNMNHYIYRLQDLLHLSTSTANLLFITCQVQTSSAQTYSLFSSSSFYQSHVCRFHALNCAFS